MKVKHIWFDFSETIANINKEEHDRLKYSAYAEVAGRPVDDELKKDFDEQYKTHNNSIADMFYSLGKLSGWWSDQVATIDPSKLYKLAEDDIPQLLLEIRKHVPISIFSNINLDEPLSALGIDAAWFDHILSSGMVGRPKPALDGFYKIVELSKVEPSQILYVGDHESKDILPAKKVGLQTGIIWNKSDKADYNFNSFQEILDFVAK